ncbi:sodium:calcium antiporter [Luteimonas sp. BDR2-5]|uniref:sodium:calcium antiporter n=1 Tax=Proluteimonas luteida TaxID=2878685 RepID=UPI001E34F1B0|nr:sodium:calcium antiporter [Luteimonas sp. BDR2-5]MCD9029294.1 sodium:calcium antiporter [Luteimonas sp. BDR2-5]
MLVSTGLVLLGVLLLALGGDSLLKGASGLAQRLGMPPFVAGLLLVAFGTSLPEFAVNVRAFAVGQPHLALGNAVGSNLVNLGLTLGVAALAAPLLLRMRLLGPMLTVLALATLALLFFGRDGTLGRGEGAVLLLAALALVALLLVWGRRESPEVRESLAAFAVSRPMLGLNLVRIAIAAALLFYGAKYTVQGALGLGVAWELSPLLIGLLPVAIATALPEVVVAVLAARRGQGDVVAGHVLGSSVFNLLVIVGGMAVVAPLSLPASFSLLELPATLAFVLVLVPMLRGDLRISRAEGGVLVAAFAVWVALELALMR